MAYDVLVVWENNTSLNHNVSETHEVSNMSFELIRNANVSVTAHRDEKNFPIAIADINGIEHRFDAKSRVSKSLELMTPADLTERLTGGSYFMIDDNLVDFRDGQYRGFVHNDDSIGALIDTLGYTDDASVKVHENIVSKDLTLGRKWSDHGITVPSYNDGGEFQSELHFGWNPFVKTINSAFMLYRLICTNGMRGLRSFMNTKIPLVNRWEEHLEIANRQIQNKVSSMVTTRMAQMGSERATVAEVALLTAHAYKRTQGAENTNTNELTRLNRIIDIANPRLHLGDVYKEEVFNDKRMAAQMPSHLNLFDVYNMATEVRSHTSAAEGSTGRGLDKLSNDLVFDRKDLTQYSSRFMQPKESQFSDPDAAFFGEMH